MFEDNPINIFHITWVTHNSRISERMKEHKVQIGKAKIFTTKEETEIAGYICEVVKNDNLKVLAFNICRDHVHLLLVCKDGQRDNIVRKLKSISARKFFQKHRELKKEKEQSGLPPFDRTLHLWAQKYNWNVVTDEDGLGNVAEYVKFNRDKHNLPVNRELEKVIEKIVTPLEDIG